MSRIASFISDAVFNALRAQLVDGRNTESVEFDSIIGGIAEGVDTFFTTAPLINSSYLSENPLQLPNAIFRILGINNQNAAFGSPFYGLKQHILKMAFEASRVSRERFSTAEEAKELEQLKERQATDQIIELCKREFHLEELEYSKHFGGGLSGSTVFRVRLKEVGADKKLAVIKITQEEKVFDSERSGLQRARDCWLADYTSASFRHTTCVLDRGKYYVLMTDLAFPPGEYTVAIPTLHEVIKQRERGRSLKILENIGRHYSRIHFTADRSNISREDFCRQLVQDNPKLKSALADAEFWFPVGIPSGDERFVTDSGKVVRNPLSLFAELDIKDEGKFEFRHGWQHGDLNARNILLRPETEAGHEWVFIDFEKVSWKPSVYDLCYLSLFLLEDSRPKRTNLDAENIKYLPESFVKAVCNNEIEKDHGDWQLGIEGSRHLFGQFWQKVKKSANEANQLRLHLRLVLSWVALQRCFYEVKALRSGKKTDLYDSTFLALLFFRISTNALQPYVVSDFSVAHPTINLSNELVDSVHRLRNSTQ